MKNEEKKDKNNTIKQTNRLNKKNKITTITEM